MSRRVGWRAIGVGVAVVVATGCAADAGADGASSGPSALAASAVHCPAEVKLPAPGAEPVPADFVTAWVLRCGMETRAVPGDGSWHFRIEERADTEAAALLAALRRPDEPTPEGTGCARVAVAAPYFALVDASGRAVRPRVPLDACGQPQRQTLDALKALPFREVATTRLNQEQSQASIDTGCGQMWTDAPAGDMLIHTKPAASRRLWQETPDALLICLWRPRGTGLPELVSAGTVTGAELAALLDRLDRLPAAEPCTTGHRQFAVIQYVRRGWYDDAAYAEVDGCRMILRPDHTRGELDPATAELLIRLSHG